MKETSPPKTSLEGPYYFGGHEVDSPLQNAAGSINGISKENIIREVSELARSGVGVITWGSITIPEQVGKGIWQFEEETGEMYNYMGLPNVGEEAGLKILPTLLAIAHEGGKPLMVSVSPTNAQEYGTSVEQAVRLATKFLEGGADLIKINVACPHMSDEPEVAVPIMGHDLDTMQELAEDLSFNFSPEEHQKLGIKVPSYLMSYHQNPPYNFTVPKYLLDREEKVKRGEEKPWMETLAKEILLPSKAISFLVAINTVPNQKEVSGYKASLSGPTDRVRRLARDQTNSWISLVGDQMEIVSTGAVDSGKEMAYRIHGLGATAVSGVSYPWRTDKFKFGRPMTWGERVTELLEDFVKASKVYEAEPT